MAKILFLEDEPALVETLPSVIGNKYNSLQIIGTTSVSDALDKVVNEEFDAILLDISMPPTADMDLNGVEHGRLTGIEVANRIKRLKPNMPIVALTVVTELRILSKMRDAGIVEVINKPAEIDAIVQMLNRVIRPR